MLVLGLVVLGAVTLGVLRALEAEFELVEGVRRLEVVGFGVASASWRFGGVDRGVSGFGVS